MPIGTSIGTSSGISSGIRIKYKDITTLKIRSIYLMGIDETIDLKPHDKMIEIHYKKNVPDYVARIQESAPQDFKVVFNK